MPIPTPFHDRTSALCTSYRWKDWSGFHAVCTYGDSPEREYNAVRQAAGLLDVSPLYKYDITGPDAGELLAYVGSRNAARLKVGRVTYLCWSDDAGKILDDGTCARLAPDHYRLTAAAPTYHWLARHAHGFDVAIEDTTRKLAALALQGPTSRDVLRQVCDADVDALRFFGIVPTRYGSVDGFLTRTGYTGDLGYELWVSAADAMALWDAVITEGKPYGVAPIGLDALDITRVEAGFILHGVDYYSASEAVIEAQKSTPYEVGLGWTVKLKRDRFIGQQALRAEQERGSAWAFVGLVIDWDALERLYDEYGLPPNVPAAAWRDAIPVYRRGRQVGRATSGTWSPILKKNLALATVKADVATPGTVLDVEVTIEWERRTVPAVVTQTPFFDPPRKRS